MILCLETGAKVYWGPVSGDFQKDSSEELESSLEQGRMLESEYHPLSVSEQRTCVCFLQVR